LPDRTTVGDVRAWSSDQFRGYTHKHVGKTEDRLDLLERQIESLHGIIDELRKRDAALVSALEKVRQGRRDFALPVRDS
jgi:hypothetical protein